MPIDYEVHLYRRMKNLKQKDLEVASYIEEFHKLSLRSGHREDEKENVAKYLNVLKFNIQDETSPMNPKIVDKLFQMDLRVEDKLRRKGEKHGRGRGGKNFRGRGNLGGRGQPQKPQGESSQQEQSRDSGSRGGFRRRRPNGRGRFGGLGRGPSLVIGRCFNCNQVGHTASKCPKKTSNCHGGERRNQLIQENDCQSVNFPIGSAAPTHDGEILMMRRTKLKVPRVKEPP